ncbi:hypothetical protein AIOL_002815 [Candidatus Rhodobacter oscarellae]|uniref:Uncharacterized protein n=2 Tax=Candidatus Rhodobacter oscarellae TaxID=1675527 RepID=A0A0J9E537_9RHOB|nr:hypothetical protein AIOL_002815 [Candidatus Rhodobacter lobularis]
MILAVLTVIPFWIILPKFRLPSWCTIFSLTPFTVIPLLWVMALRDRVKIPGLER